MRNFAGFCGRLLIAVLFFGGAVQKATDPAAAKMLLEARGWPVWLVWPAMLLNAAAAVAIVSGVLMEPAALLLAAYCAVTSLFHYLPEDPWQMTIFVKNWAIAGGCMVLAAGGGGAWRLRPPH